MGDETLRELIEPVLRAHMNSVAFDHADVRSGVDHDGDPALFIAVHYRPGQEPLKAEVTMNAASAVRDVLLARGEIRFPYISYLSPSDDYPEDPVDAASDAGPGR